jgi:hypothetical protein
MSSISDDFESLITISQIVPENRNILGLKIQQLCAKIKETFPQSDRSTLTRFLLPLKSSLSALQKANIFAKILGGQAAEKAMNELIVQLDPTDEVYQKLKFGILQHTEIFEKIIKETKGVGIHPDLLMKILTLLIIVKPASFVRVIPYIQLSAASQAQLHKFMHQYNRILYDFFFKPQSQIQKIRLLFAYFPDVSPWEIENEVLTYFRPSNGLNPQQWAAYAKHMDGGICLGTSIHHLTGKNYDQHHIRFLQAASQVGISLEQQHQFLLEIGKEILKLPDDSLIKKRMEKILGKSLQNASLEDKVLCFYVGAAAYRFYTGISKDTPEASSYLDLEKRIIVATGKVVTDSQVPERLLKKEKLAKVITIAKAEPLKEFLKVADKLDKGLYYVGLVNPENHNAHSISFSLDDLTFCDANDINPANYEPYVHKFQTKKELLNYLNAHMAVIYKSFKFSVFSLVQLKTIADSGCVA